MHTFPIVITGHVDHGKSTLIGRLLYDTGTLQAERRDEMKQSSADAGRESEFAFVLDAFEEERRRGITIDTSQIFFHTANRSYVIIDAPGHREFIRNMVTGASYAEAAVLIVDAQEGIREQTRRHAWLLAMVGIQNICVVINKMDTVGYDKARYRFLCKEIQELFEELLLVPYAIIPIAAVNGENIASRSLLMPWYFGPCLVEILDNFEAKPLGERPFRFPVQDIFDVEGTRVVVGRVESGSIASGDAVYLLPDQEELKVREIRRYPLENLTVTSYGEAVGLVLDGETKGIGRGMIIAGGDLPRIGRRFSANIFWFHDDYKNGTRVILRCATQEVPATLFLERVFDPAEPDIPLSSDRLTVGECARCTILAEKDLVVDNSALIPELGRFVIECDNVPAGGGVFR